MSMEEVRSRVTTLMDSANCAKRLVVEVALKTLTIMVKPKFRTN